MIPALADVGAGGAFADRVQAEALHEALEIAVIVAARRGRAQPGRAVELGGDGNQHYPYCTGMAATPTRAAAFSS